MLKILKNLFGEKKANDVLKSSAANNDKLESDVASASTPSASPGGTSAKIIADLKMLSEVFERIENETSEIAELLFEILINASDEQIINGTIPAQGNSKIARYIAILNRLFLLSRKHSKKGGVRVISRKTVQELDKKTFAICMCFDGGVSLDILCDVVNTENRERTPTKSPQVKVTIQAFGEKIERDRGR